MTSRIVVNNIQADAGISTVTFASNIQGNLIGNVTGNINATGVSTIATLNVTQSNPTNLNVSGVTTTATLRATNIVGVNTVGVVTVYASGSLQTNSIVPVGGIPAGVDGGGIIQVVQIVKRDTFSVSQSRAGWSAVTGLSLNITPRSTSSKILLISSITSNMSTSGAVTSAIYRGGSIITGYQSTAATYNYATAAAYENALRIRNHSMMYLDSPSSTSQQTYQVYVSNDQSANYTIYINYDGGGTSSYGGVSSLIAMEVSG